MEEIGFSRMQAMLCHSTVSNELKEMYIKKYKKNNFLRPKNTSTKAAILMHMELGWRFLVSTGKCAMDQLLLIMDDILELVHWPEAEFPRQSLEGCGGCTDFNELDPKLDRGAAGAGNWQQARNGMECAAVRILCRQHASIQGELRVNGITANFQTHSGSQITVL